MSAPVFASKLTAIGFWTASRLLLPATSAEVPPQAHLSATDPARAIFADHDCCGRLANSEITKIGELRSGMHRLTIYDLWFVNPENSHGMRHVAIVERRRLVGSYITSSEVMPKIENDRVRFVCAPQKKCDPTASEDLVFDDGLPPKRLWVDGEVHELEDTI